MTRGASVLLVGTLLSLGGCSADESPKPPPAVEPPAGDCAPGELPQVNGDDCRSAGIAPEQCTEGFSFAGTRMAR